MGREDLSLGPLEKGKRSPKTTGKAQPRTLIDCSGIPGLQESGEAGNVVW